MTKTLGGLLSSIWLLAVGFITIVNFTHFNMMQPVNDGYFGFQSFKSMLSWINTRLEFAGLGFDNTYNELLNFTQSLKINNPLDFARLVTVVNGAFWLKLLQFIWYLLNVPAVLLECFAMLIIGKFNIPYNFDKFDELVPLMSSPLDYLTIG